MAMMRAQFPKSLRPGLNAVFGLTYNQYPQEWAKVFDTKQSRKAYEEQVLRVGFSSAPIKPEGQAFDEDSGAESWTARYVHVTVALKFALTEESLEDNLYEDLGQQYSKALARAMLETKEIVCANVLNNGFSASYLIGDGKALLASDHPLWYGGTLSNILATPADISESALEDLLTQIRTAVDDRGVPIMLKPMRLIIPPQLIYTAQRLLKSTLRTGTPDNDINAINSLGIFGEPAHVITRLTDSNAWFIKTDCDLGLQYFQRTAIQRRQFQDDDNGNYTYVARERFSAGATNPRGIFGSSGAA